MLEASIAQSDSGMFNVNLRDERFLPFEGAGVESTWRMELRSEFRKCYYDTISDVILHIRYTPDPELLNLLNYRINTYLE